MFAYLLVVSLTRLPSKYFIAYVNVACHLLGLVMESRCGIKISDLIVNAITNKSLTELAFQRPINTIFQVWTILKKLINPSK